MRSLFLFLIRTYQWVISPMIGSSCRFYPSCSCYGHQAIARFGAWRGLLMTLTRLSRCHPWNEGGYDPVDSTSIDLKDATQLQPSASSIRLNQHTQ